LVCNNLRLVFLHFIWNRRIFEVLALNLSIWGEVFLVNHLTFSKCTPDAFIFNFLKFKIIGKANTCLMIPHITKITTNHHIRSIFWLPADTKQVFIFINNVFDFSSIDQILLKHPALEVFDWSDLQYSLSEYFPNGGNFFQRVQKLN
jgi:hypothetical protein